MARPNHGYARSIAKTNDIPGPGTYDAPSEFGTLDMPKFTPRTSHG